MTSELTQPSRSSRRLAWSLCAAILVATVASGLLALRLKPPGNVLQAISTLTSLIGFAVFGVTGALVVSRQPRNAVGWLLMLEGCLAFVWPVGTYYDNLAQPPADPSLWFSIGMWFYSWMWLWYIFPVLFIPLLFPTGRPPSRRWRWLVVLGLGLCAFFILYATTVKQWTKLDGSWSVTNPVGFHNLAFPVLPWAVLLLAFAVLGVASLWVRFRHAQTVERQQIKWLLYAAGVFLLYYAVGFVTSTTSGVFADITSALLSLGILAFPIAIAIAILRYRLYDIDVIIRKTLVYSVLTVLLALVFFGVVGLLQTMFGRMTGVEQSPLAVVISTLAIAALFTPLRRRIQDWIDRRFYRQKYNAQQVLAQFTQTARDETDLDALTGELARVAQETMQPGYLSVWLRK